MLPAQFLLLLWAAEFAERHWEFKSMLLPNQRTFVRAAILLAILGVSSNILGLILLRGRVLFAEMGKAPIESFSRYQDEGERLNELRSAYEWIRSNTGPDVVVQENPVLGQTFMQAQYSERKTAIYYPVDPLPEESLDREYRPAFELIRPLFEGNASARQMAASCDGLGIRYLVVQDSDPVWSAKGSYVWTESPAFASPRVRVIRC
jgi:hypothetical protein